MRVFAETLLAADEDEVRNKIKLYLFFKNLDLVTHRQGCLWNLKGPARERIFLFESLKSMTFRKCAHVFQKFRVDMNLNIVKTRKGCRLFECWNMKNLFPKTLVFWHDEIAGVSRHSELSRLNSRPKQ